MDVKPLIIGTQAVVDGSWRLSEQYRFRVKVFRIVVWGPLLEQDVVRAVAAESLYK